MTIDERLAALKASLDRLHVSVTELSQQVHAFAVQQRVQDAKEARLRRIMLKNIRAFLDGEANG